MDKERNGLPSASSMERYHACGAALPLERMLRERGELPEDTGSEAATHGTLIHAIAASLMLPEREDLQVAGASASAIEEAQLYVEAARDVAMRAWGADDDAEVIVEERMYLTDPTGKQIATGQADLIFLRQKEAVVIDYKTGWASLKQAKESWQLRLYAAMAFQKYQCTSIRVAYIHQGRFHSEEIIDRNDLEVLASLLFPGMLDHIDENPFWQSFAPGDDVCRYCACKLKCPALNAQYMLMEPKAKVDSSFLPSLSNDQLQEMMTAFDALRELEKSLSAEMTARAQADGAAFTEYEIAPGRSRRTIENAAALCEALAGEGADLSDIYKAVKLGIRDAENIHRKMTGLKGAVAKADFEERFGDLVTQQEGKPALRKRKDA